MLGRNEIIGPFTDAIDQSIQIQIQTDFLSFIIEESKEFPPKDIETEFAKLGFDYSDFDQILKVFGQAFVGMPAGEPERCLKVIETHKSLFLGENLDKR